MQVLLGICLLSALLAGGIALECEVCRDVGRNCTGHIETCPPGYDFCAITAFESVHKNIKTNGIVKNCVPASACESGATRLNMGKKGRTRTHVSCCKDNGCNTVLPFKLPSINTEVNGLQCLACYGLLSDPCDIVNCTGSEEHCLDLIGLIDYGDFSEKVVQKGCVSESMCVADGTEAATFPGSSSTLIKLDCTPANSVASKSPGSLQHVSRNSVASKCLGSTGLFLSAIFGFLLAKF